MNQLSLNERDLDQINSHGLTNTEIQKQYQLLRSGFNPLTLDRPCSTGDGIHVLESATKANLTQFFDEACNRLETLVFVPASGVGSRMFGFLASMLQYGIEKQPQQVNWEEYFSLNPDHEPLLQTFLKNIGQFPFYDALAGIMQQQGFSIENCIEKKDYLLLLKYLLTSDGLHYLEAPKGLVPFHRYKDGPRTPFVEHLLEANRYLRQFGKPVCLHFTVAPEYLKNIQKEINDFLADSPVMRDLKFSIHYSVQSPETDTIALGDTGNLFRASNGQILFRPGGHGALLNNLVLYPADLIFIKNIDNLGPDRLKHHSTETQKVLAGFLLHEMKTIHSLCDALKSNPTEAVCTRAREYLQRCGLILSEQSKTCANELFKALHRPIRVVGVVPNDGEPGGAPFWVEDERLLGKPQIVERSQIQENDPRQRDCFESSTHFNPVNLVVSIKDYEGSVFDLSQFSDDKSSFITHKSHDGRDLTALEHPGLWNGGMGYWLSFFVEVPGETFHPVKTVLDLLRPDHLCS